MRKILGFAGAALIALAYTSAFANAYFDCGSNVVPFTQNPPPNIPGSTLTPDQCLAEFHDNASDMAWWLNSTGCPYATTHASSWGFDTISGFGYGYFIQYNGKPSTCATRTVYYPVGYCKDSVTHLATNAPCLGGAIQSGCPGGLTPNSAWYDPFVPNYQHDVNCPVKNG